MPLHLTARMGEGIADENKEKIIVVVERHPAVVKVINLLSTYQSPDEIVLMLIVAFRDDLTTPQINKAIDELRITVKREFRLVHFVIIQPGTSLAQYAG